MKLVPTGFPGEFTAQRPRMIYLFIGGVIATMGVFSLLLFGGVIPIKVDGEAPGGGAIAIGAVFTTIGLLLLLFKRGFDLSERTRELRAWWKIGPFGGNSVRKLDQCDGVVLDTRVVRSNNSSRTVFTVLLRGGGPKLEVAMVENHRASRAIGEQIAKAARLPLIDATDGEEVVRQYDELDQSVRDRARASGEKIELPDPPPGALSTLSMQGQTVVVDIPASGMKPMHWLILSIVTVPGILFGALIMTFTADVLPLPARIVVAVVILFGPLVGLTGLILFLAKRSWHIELDRDAITVERSGLFAKSWRLAADDVEEIVVGGTHKSQGAARLPLLEFNPVTILTDAETVSFGDALPEREAQYLGQLVRAVLSS